MDPEFNLKDTTHSFPWMIGNFGLPLKRNTVRYHTRADLEEEEEIKQQRPRELILAQI